MADVLIAKGSNSSVGKHEAPNYLNQHTGLRSWLTTIDHKKIGVMYLWSIMFFFMIGGLLALLLRIEHLGSKQTIMDAETYNRVFTLHGAIMVFLFIIPSIPAALGNFILPLMIGAKDVAFPRLNLASYYIYVTGALMAIGSIVIGAVDTGWTFYTPYSTTTGGAVGMMSMAVFVLGFSSIFTGINFIATIHKLRAPGMGWFQMPLFCWGIYATAIIQVLATPVLGITMVLLLMGFLSGTLIPRQLLPDSMQKLSLVTPHAWALNAYQDLILRHKPLLATLPNIGVVLLFGAVFFGLALARFRFE